MTIYAVIDAAGNEYRFFSAATAMNFRVDLFDATGEETQMIEKEI